MTCQQSGLQSGLQSELYDSQSHVAASGAVPAGDAVGAARSVSEMPTERRVTAVSAGDGLRDHQEHREPITAASASDGLTGSDFMAGLQVLVMNECETVDQANAFIDAWHKPVFDRRDIVGHVITITSVRERQSEYGDRTFTVIGFTSDALGDGQIKIGGHAAILPMHLAESDSLPVDLILRHKLTSAGRNFWKWEYPPCQI